ncbi:hypothetical protein [Sinorhizobium fredii]|uniref:hypothetical protein n=1 Tax=Rhizobium fredii TaxID=380 RepID=UPI003514C4E5
MTNFPDPLLPNGDYPFVDQRYPLADLVMIEVPDGLQKLLIEQAAKNGQDMQRDVPVELRCQTEEFGVQHS